jgi:cell division protein FtsL
MTAPIITVLATVSVALISLVGTIVTANSNTARLQAELEKHNAVQDTKLEELTREIRQLSELSSRIPVLEQKVVSLEKEVFKK